MSFDTVEALPYFTPPPPRYGTTGAHVIFCQIFPEFQIAARNARPEKHALGGGGGVPISFFSGDSSFKIRSAYPIWGYEILSDMNNFTQKITIMNNLTNKSL